jgi:hypothetical protein
MLAGAYTEKADSNPSSPGRPCTLLQTAGTVLLENHMVTVVEFRRLRPCC